MMKSETTTETEQRFATIQTEALYDVTGGQGYGVIGNKVYTWNDLHTKTTGA